MRTNELMLYKNMDYGDILQDMTFLMENYDSEFYNKEDLRSLLFECVNQLLELSVSHGFEGNLWHTYLTFLLVNDENAYSTSCEIVGEIEGSINEVALHDFSIFKELFDYVRSHDILHMPWARECPWRRLHSGAHGLYERQQGGKDI